MSNKEWIDLLAKEFEVSRTVAKTMLHLCMNVKGTYEISKEWRKEDGKKETV